MKLLRGSLEALGRRGGVTCLHLLLLGGLGDARESAVPHVFICAD
jgi:hypothetical protein